MGSGVSGAIFRGAGEDELAKACVPFAPIDVHSPIITPGFRLPNRFIIHCCGPKYKVHSDAEKQLADCYRETLLLAEKNHITSLAIPAISTGAFGFPIEDATRICINTIKDFSPEFENLKTIRFVVKDEATANIYKHYLHENIPVPVNAVKVTFDAHFTQDQFNHIRKGYIGDQDSKWFFYFDDPWLYIFRGNRQYGACYWFLKFEPTEGGYQVSEAWLDKGPNGDLFKDEARLLDSLIYEFLPMSFYALGSTPNGYSFHPNGRVQLEITSRPLSIEEVRSLGLLLIEFADSCDAELPKKQLS